MTDTPVMIVDDEADMRASIAQWLELSGFTPQTFASATDALSALSEDWPGVIITDVRMPQMSGMEFLTALQEIDPELPVILITGHGDVEMAVEAMRAGAYDFIEKPFDPERLANLTKRAGSNRRLVIDNRLLRRGLTDGSDLMRRIMGTSEPVKILRENLEAYATGDTPVRIEGERGTGRSLVARVLHAIGPNPQQPFIAINCAAERPERLEEQLFRSDRFGNPPILAAGRGTVCLENIGLLPDRIQSLLLATLTQRHLPDGTALSARVLSISEMNETGLIPSLEDTLSALTLYPPPLRACSGDILTLFIHYVESFAQDYETPRPAVSAEDAAQLIAHPWPGNHRQLINIAERFVLKARQSPVSVADILQEADTPVALAQATQGLRDQVDAFEKLMIEEALRRHRGSISEAIDDLQIPRRTLNEKMAKHGVVRSDYI